MSHPHSPLVTLCSASSASVPCINTFRDLVPLPVAFNPTLPASSGLELLFADTTSPAVAESKPVAFTAVSIAASSGEMLLLLLVLLLLGVRSSGKLLVAVSM